MNEDVFKLASEINGLQNINLLNVENEVNYIIKNNITNFNTIENTLDKILDLRFYFGDSVNELYYGLLNYYKTLNIEASNDYKKIYINY